MGEDVSQSHTTESSIKRRRALKALGATATAGLAGCLGDDDDSDGTGDADDTLGERVGTQDIEFWSNLGGSSEVAEGFLPTFEENVEERLGVEMELVPTEWATNIGHITNDERTCTFTTWAFTNTLARFDPHPVTRTFGADYAGANGQQNPPNWANCEYTYHAVQQSSATDEEERREHVNAAQRIMTEEVPVIPVFDYIAYGAVNENLVDPGGIGEAGIVDTNPLALIKSTPLEGDQLVYNISTATVQTSNFLTIDFVPGIWTSLVHSSLVTYNENYELENVLADSIDVSDDGLTVTVSIVEGTFHNGDPITAEDVQFTFELLSNNSDSYPNHREPPYESINVIDEHTVEFNLEEAYPALTTSTFAQWGILHKPTWEDAMDDPGGFDFDPMIGSGPFQVDTFNVGENLQLSAADDHPVYDVDHGLYLQTMEEPVTIVEAFLAEEVHLAARLTGGTLERINNEMSDAGQVATVGGLFNWTVCPQTNHGPGKFQEFREAVAVAINRQEANQIATQGRANIDLYANVFSELHPWRTPNEELHQLTDDPTGDEERARELLSEAGWGWDNDENLCYPPDADLGPLWPEGETADPEDFPCVTEDNVYDSSYSI